MKNTALLLALFLSLGFYACQDKSPEPDNSPHLIFKFKFDPNQERLNELGNPATPPAGNAGQSPTFNAIAAHYFELSPTEFTQLGQGNVLYHAPETQVGGSTAIDFDQSIVKGENEIYLSIPLKDISPKTYEYLRISLAYQNYDISFRFSGVDYQGTIASFIGYNTYIRDVQIKNSQITLNENRSQGYWAFETINGVLQGQAPGTTVPNPIAATSPIPAGSCVVTAKFDTPLIITGNETQDMIITASLSTNKSFEWKDNNGNGYFEPALDEMVVDMGIRGMKILVE
ncbi:MAG: hypothetical protein HC913_21835 [Microscillaceae bacterium]|nr:hypothetical protein [Microscillaceae bacterium]